MSDYSANSYPYLEASDAAFCRAFRLSEDKFLELCGGLKRYTQLRLDRQAARGATMADGSAYSVPPLPTDIKPYLVKLKMSDVADSTEIARQLLSDHMNKVTGINDASVASERLQANEARRIADKESSRQWQLREFQKGAAARFGWKPDSQSAKDWAEAEMARRGW
jgi:hypothetical protein